MYIKFLGTGAGVPSKFRNTQSFVFNFMQELKECWLFDCGEATQHKMLDTTLKPSKINRIFISHMHADHVLGLIGFLISRNFLLNNNGSNLTIYGPKGIEEYIKINLKLIKSKLLYDIKFIELEEKENVILENDIVKVISFPLEHGIICFGYKIIFKEQKGNIKEEKLKEIGIMPSPFYKKIKENETFIYNEKKYYSKEFLTENKKEKVITIIADTSYFEKLNEYLKNTNILITECTYLKENEENLAKKHNHLHITNILDFIKVETFDKIYLTHISSKYENNFLYEFKKKYDKKNIFLTKDLAEFDL